MARRGLRSLRFAPLRRRSARFRLTALYCSLFFPSGVALVAITYVVIVLFRSQKIIAPLVRSTRLVGAHRGAIAAGLAPPVVRTVATGGAATVTIAHEITLDYDQFLVASAIVLVALIAVSVLIGWLAAGRVLRPLRVMTTTTRQISERNLHERLALSGPEDELKHLGDTIDGLLARLEAAFDSERRFVANASHELRTPLMLSQTLLQVALADPALSLDSLRVACVEAIDAGKDQAQLIDTLLTLARSQRGLDQREQVDLRALVGELINAHAHAAAARGLQLDAALDQAEVSGDGQLIARLVSNLLDNAVRYNSRGGRVKLELTAGTSEATVTVTNTGAPVPPEEISRLLEPFQRAAAERIASPHGLGLGLSIVAEIAKAHGARLEIDPRLEGGLTVAVSFPVDAPVQLDEGRQPAAH